MAKIKFGMMMTDARGKLGGQVFSKNRSGAYVRTKVTPVNPRTSFQQSNRALLGSLSSNWSGLTSEERTEWNNAVNNWQSTNVFGDNTTPTGKNLFTGLNKVAASQFPTNDLMRTPPAKVEMVPYSIGSAIADTANQTLIITLANTETVGKTFQVRATPIVSSGTTFVTNRYRSLSSAFTVASGGVLDISSAWLARFGAIAETGNIFVEIREVQENGQLGVPAVSRVNFL